MGVNQVARHFLGQLFTNIYKNIRHTLAKVSCAFILKCVCVVCVCRVCVSCVCVVCAYAFAVCACVCICDVYLRWVKQSSEMTFEKFLMPERPLCVIHRNYTHTHATNAFWLSHSRNSQKSWLLRISWCRCASVHFMMGSQWKFWKVLLQLDLQCTQNDCSADIGDLFTTLHLRPFDNKQQWILVWEI